MGLLCELSQLACELQAVLLSARLAVGVLSSFTWVLGNPGSSHLCGKHFISLVISPVPTIATLLITSSKQLNLNPGLVNKASQA